DARQCKQDARVNPADSDGFDDSAAAVRRRLSGIRTPRVAGTRGAPYSDCGAATVGPTVDWPRLWRGSMQRRLAPLAAAAGVLLLAGAASARQADPGDEVPKLVVSLKDHEAAKRAAAARILGELGAPAKAAVPELTEALKDDARDVRQNAAHALGDIG